MLPTADTQHTAVYRRGNERGKKKKKDGLWYDCGNCNESICFRSKTTMHRTESASRVNMAAQIEGDERVKKNERGKSTSIKEKCCKWGKEETIFCISTFCTASSESLFLHRIHGHSPRQSEKKKLCVLYTCRSVPSAPLLTGIKMNAVYVHGERTSSPACLRHVTASLSASSGRKSTPWTQQQLEDLPPTCLFSG